jgi:transcription elongation factor Elf1
MSDIPTAGTSNDKAYMCIICGGDSYIIEGTQKKVDFKFVRCGDKGLDQASVKCSKCGSIHTVRYVVRRTE